MQPEPQPAAEMEDSWVLAEHLQSKSTEPFLVVGNKCFREKEIPFAPLFAFQDRQSWRRNVLNGSAATWPRGSAAEGASQISNGREGNPKIELKGKKETKEPQILVFNAKSQLPRLPVTLAIFLVVAMETGGMERASPCGAVAAPGIISGGRETPGARRFVLWQGGRREGLFLLAPTSCASFSLL